MLDTYDSRENETLEVLRIYPMKTLALEEKMPGEQFEIYDPTQMIIKINLWREGLLSLSEEILKPTKIRVKQDMTIEDL